MEEKTIDLKDSHVEKIIRLTTLINYQRSILDSLSNELRQFILIGYEVDINTVQVTIDATNKQLHVVEVNHAISSE